MCRAPSHDRDEEINSKRFSSPRVVSEQEADFYRKHGFEELQVEREVCRDTFFSFMLYLASLCCVVVESGSRVYHHASFRPDSEIHITRLLGERRRVQRAGDAGNASMEAARCGGSAFASGTSPLWPKRLLPRNSVGSYDGSCIS